MLIVAVAAVQIFNKEHFAIVFTNKAETESVPPVFSAGEGCERYQFDKAAPSSMTVSQWKKHRFQAAFREYGCRVILASGVIAHEAMSLKEVRESYEEGDPTRLKSV